MKSDPTQKRSQVRAIDDGPFCWQSKPALRRIRDGYDSKTYLSDALAVYVALCELASDAQSESFQRSRRSIAERAGVSLRQVARVLDVLQALKLIHVSHNSIEGTKELCNNTYTLRRVSATSGTPVPTSCTTVPTSGIPVPRSCQSQKIHFGTGIEESPEESLEQVCVATEPHARNGKPSIPSLEEWMARAGEIGLNLGKAEIIWTELDASGWRDADMQPIRNWRSFQNGVKGRSVQESPVQPTARNAPVVQPTEQRRVEFKPPTETELKAYAEEIGLAEWKATDVWQEMEACGWVDSKGRKVADWKRFFTEVRCGWVRDGKPQSMVEHLKTSRPKRQRRPGPLMTFS